MIEFCDVMLDFYPKEISKIHDRVNKFSTVKNDWISKKDLWK